MILTFHQPADRDYVISIEYNSELLNRMSKNWRIMAWQNQMKLVNKFIDIE